jgi:hypothetical protein
MDNIERIYTDTGLINDVEANLLKICKRAFEENESLRFLQSYYPKEWKDQDGNRVGTIEDLPALYVWCEGITPTTDSIGHLSGRELNQKLAFLCNVKYMLPLIEDREGDKALKEIAWYLFNEITENQNLNGLISGPTVIVDVDLKPEILRVGDKIRQLSTVSFKIVYLYQRRTKMARV